MKLKDHVRKILGRRTSEERHHAAKLQRKAQRDEQKAAIKEAIRNALAAKEAESPDAAKARLNAQFEAEAAKPDFDQRIPHPDINYNLKAKGAMPTTTGISSAVRCSSSFHPTFRSLVTTLSRRSLTCWTMAVALGG